MYKISINETPLVLMNTKDLSDTHQASEQQLVLRYTNKPKFLLNVIDMLEKTDRLTAVFIHSDKYEKLVKDFTALYTIIEAAGGLIFNDAGEILAMYRRDSWDLPKGKIDEGETTEIAAIREVQEETGIQQVTLGSLLTITWHTYKDRKGVRILKKTYWYRMTTSETNVTPQTEEDIEQLIWIKPATFLATKTPIYNTIRTVVEAGL